MRRLHNAIAQEKWMYFALCKLPVVYTYEDMVSILRQSITDLSAFVRQRKIRQNAISTSKPNLHTSMEKVNPWTDDAGTPS